MKPFMWLVLVALMVGFYFVGRWITRSSFIEVFTVVFIGLSVIFFGFLGIVVLVKGRRSSG
jgi:hypothetical protein